MTEKKSHQDQSLIDFAGVAPQRASSASWKVWLAVLIAISGVVIYFFLRNQSQVQAISVLSVSLVLALLIILVWADIGKNLLEYIKNSIVEFRKVVWPTRQAAIKMTTFVVLFTVISAIFLYGVDSLIVWLFQIIFVRN